MKKGDKEFLEDRRMLIAQQDEEYNKSLKVDQEKMLKLAAEEDMVTKQLVRQARVSEKPSPEVSNIHDPYKCYKNIKK